MPKKTTTQKVHKKKDPSTRKKSTNPYILYSKTVRADVTRDHPEFKPKEIVTFISSMWHALPEDEKEKFKRLAEELRQNPDRNKPAADDSKVEVVDTAPATNEKADSN